MYSKVRSVPVCALGLVFLVLCASGLDADFVRIEDGYVGGDPNSSSYVGQDVIGRTDWFGVDFMEVGVAGGDIHFNIHTSYLDNIGQYQTLLGDLFLSEDGWKPYGPAPYVDDYAGQGETWEYAVHLTPGRNGSGVASLYSTSQGAIEESYAPSGYIYREFQEVLFDPSGASPIATGAWSILTDPLGGQDHVLSISVPYVDQLAVPSLGVHWTMSCGNDVIEGAYTIPEPGTIFLLGSALGGLALARRRRRKA
ncbi:MAG: PEP-CTERM sorting domain-containing protein [Planctomycetes bacterium]|nr:PEP-CTERM sorting domain-containing protein [Planctomycetota bacterium]